MPIVFTPAFWVAAADRAIRTFAQVLAGAIVVGQTSLADIDWPGALSLAGAATLFSLLMAVASPARIVQAEPDVDDEPEQ